MYFSVVMRIKLPGILGVKIAVIKQKKKMIDGALFH